MGLDIYGEKTGHSLSGSYSRLHHTARYLAMKYCGMPADLGVDSNGDAVDSFCFYMHPWADDKKLDVTKMTEFHFVCQQAGYYFPNLLMHSDCEGDYTRRGKWGGHHLMTGNSVKLLKELELLCAEEEYINSDNERIKRAMEYTVAFRDLVKDELENGNGRILFR
jgi:hypothetical protein